MLNKTGITKVVGTAPVQILFNVQNQFSVGIKVDDANYVTENGRKIVKAGTPLSGNLEARETAFVKATTSSGSSNAVGILLHDVDVTDRDANGTLLIWGFVDLNKLDTATRAVITTEVKTALKGGVTFLK